MSSIFATATTQPPSAPSVSADAEKQRLAAAKSAYTSMPGSESNIYGGAKVAADEYGKTLLAKKALS